MPPGPLWAPWRLSYLKQLKRARGRAAARPACFLCAGLKGRDDRGSLVVERGRLAFCILNRYPYNNGHLMIVPNRHTADFTGLGKAETAEISALTQAYVKALKRTLNPDGFNIGTNLGRAGGAGLETHLHVHIVPRWSGDTNFITTLGDTRVVSQSMAALYAVLRKARGLK